MSHGKQIFVPRVGTVEVRSDPGPGTPPGPGEVLIRTGVLGICGSDLHVLHGRHPVGRPPTAVGHELAAEVRAVGPGVDGIAVGDRAIVDPIMNCGDCPACRAGRPNLCEPPRVAGFRAPGFGRSEQLVPARNLHRAPAGLAFEDLVLAEPAACAAHCVSRVPQELRDAVLVIGAGTIGLAIVQALRLSGAELIQVVEPDQLKRELAVRLGADRADPPGTPAGSARFSAVIDVVAIQPTLDEAFQRVRPGGRVVLMGVPAGSLRVPGAEVQRFERDLVGSGMYRPGDFDTAVQWIASGRFRTGPLVSAVLPVQRAAEAFALAGRPETIKILVRFGDR